MNELFVLNVNAMMSDDYDEIYDNISVQMTYYNFIAAFQLLNIQTFEHANWMEDFEYVQSHLITKLGQCSIFNAKYTSDLMKVNSDVVDYRFTAFSSTRLDHWLTFYHNQIPYKTTTKDLGVELHVYEGENRFNEFPKSFDIGFDITISSADELLDDNSQFYHVDLNNSYLVYIIPTMTTIHESLIALKPEE